MENLPLLIEPAQLEAVLDSPDLVIVDLCKASVYGQLHVPGAFHVEYGELIDGNRPAPGLLPGIAKLQSFLDRIPISPQSSVVAYDDEGGGRAARLLWTLHVVGHRKVSVLNGGIHAWANEGHPVTPDVPEAAPGYFRIETLDESVMARKDLVLSRLGSDTTTLLDARTPEEYTGVKSFAARGGHIPGAINLNWIDTMDQHKNLRLLPEDNLRATLDRLNIDSNNEIITYCQTHHRSAHTYMMLKHLDYPNVRGYAGSWSEWGNSPEVPVEM